MQPDQAHTCMHGNGERLSHFWHREALARAFNRAAAALFLSPAAYLPLRRAVQPPLCEVVERMHALKQRQALPQQPQPLSVLLTPCT